jgi:hypothetical protein
LPELPVEIWLLVHELGDEYTRRGVAFKLRLVSRRMEEVSRLSL